MTTAKNKTFSFDRSRTPSPQVFRNDFDGESDDEVDTFHEANDTGANHHDNTNQCRSDEIVDIIKPNFIWRQENNDSHTEQTHGLAFPIETNGPSDELQNGIGTTSQLSDETQYATSPNPKAFINPSTEDVCDERKYEMTDGEDFKAWNKSWTLEDDDLIETKQSVDPSIRIDPSVIKSDEMSKGKSYKASWAKYQKYPRVFHTRPSRKSYNAIMKKKQSVSYVQSPLTILVNLAERFNMELHNLLDNYDKGGFNELTRYRFPCMQCYEREGTSGKGYDNYYGGSSESYYDDYSYASGDTEKCNKCGGSIQTMSSFIKMLKVLKHRILENDLVVHDVYPDGNCVFGAVVDQLRIRGVFSYTINNLRQVAVDYLSRNPMSSDGETHFELFLTDETWEQYLSRMRKDGEWGDHMILSAISNVTNQRIVIFGGRSGEGQTIILPTSMQEADKTINAEKTEDTAESDDKERGISEERVEDTLTAKSTATDESDVRSFDKTGTIFLGHFGESHYVSLRPRDWEERLLCPEAQRTKEHIDETSLQASDQSTSAPKIHMKHLNFFLLQLFQLGYLTSANCKQVDFIAISKNSKEASEEGIGKVINKLAPCFDEVQLLAPDVGMFLPSEQRSNNAHNAAVEVGEVDESELCTYLHIPNDSRVVNHTRDIRKFDLLAEEVDQSTNLIRLVPYDPEKWFGNTIEEGTTEYLEAMDPFRYENKIMAFAMPWSRQSKPWTTRERRVCWPDSSTINEIEENGCHAVPITIAVNFEDFDDDCYMVSDEQVSDKSLWIVSFAVPERKLARDIISSAQRHVYYLFALFVEHILQDNSFTRTACKHIFFHACENIDKMTWEESPATCLLLLLKKLSDSLERSFIPHYFVPSRNLLHGFMDDMLQGYRRRLELARHSPMVVLYFLLDAHNVTSTEMGSFMDGIIEDTPNDDPRRAVIECFIPGCCGLLESVVYQGDYEFAMNVLLCLKAEMARSGVKNPRLSEIINKGLWNMHTGYRWCLAFYFDIKKGLSITKDVVEGLPKVPITEVFGPEITSILPDTFVQKALTPAYGDLNFPTEVVKVLTCAGEIRALSKCLRYYLDTYYDIFHEADKGVQMPLATSTLLFNLYVSLCDCYMEIGEKEEFRDLLPRFIDAGDDLGTTAGFETVNRICKLFGEHGRSDDTKKKKQLTVAILQF